MTVMVDELIRWPRGRGIFLGGSSHLTASTIDELHTFAEHLELPHTWFQDHPRVPHYDLTPRMREKALRGGAKFVPAKDQARLRLGLVDDGDVWDG